MLSLLLFNSNGICNQSTKTGKENKREKAWKERNKLSFAVDNYCLHRKPKRIYRLIIRINKKV